MELDHKLEIVCERKQHGIENTEWQITGDQKGCIESKRGTVLPQKAWMTKAGVSCNSTERNINNNSTS